MLRLEQLDLLVLEVLDVEFVHQDESQRHEHRGHEPPQDETVRYPLLKNANRPLEPARGLLEALEFGLGVVTPENQAT